MAPERSKELFESQQKAKRLSFKSEFINPILDITRLKNKNRNFVLKSLLVVSLEMAFRAELRHAISTCVDSMQLRFQRNYTGWLKTNVINLKTQTHAVKCTLKTRVATRLKA